MKSTLLDLAQDISSSMDGDEFGSISDTFESEQIVTILRTVYRDIISNRNWPHLKKAINLVPSISTDFPTHMTIAENVKELVLINYNKQKNGTTRLDYQPVTWQENDEFLRRQNALNNDNDTVDVIADPTGVQLLIQNNKAPDYYTSFDDNTLVFDSYDEEIDSTLVGSKFQGVAYLMPDVFLETDSFIVDLPEEAFSAFYNEAKSLAFLELRQQGHAKAEQVAGKQQRWLARKAWRVNGGIQYPDYGRRSVKGRRAIKRSRDFNNGT